MSSWWCIRSDSPFLSHAHVCVPWLPVNACALQFSSLLHCAPVSSVWWYLVSLMLLSQNTPRQSRGEVPTYYCYFWCPTWRGRQPKREVWRERGGRFSLSPVSLSLSGSALDNKLLKSAGCTLFYVPRAKAGTSCLTQIWKKWEIINNIK